MRFLRKTEEAEPPEPVTYTYVIYPSNVADGEYELDGSLIQFEKPGWQWVIKEHEPHRWAKVYKMGTGYHTRDAALVDLLTTIRGIEDQRGATVE